MPETTEPPKRNDWLDVGTLTPAGKAFREGYELGQRHGTTMAYLRSVSIALTLIAVGLLAWKWGGLFGYW